MDAKYLPLAFPLHFAVYMYYHSKQAETFHILPAASLCLPADCRLGVCPRADASVVLPPVPRPALPAAVPLSVPQRDERLSGESGRPGHRVEQLHRWVRLLEENRLLLFSVRATDFSVWIGCSVLFTHSHSAISQMILSIIYTFPKVGSLSLINLYLLLHYNEFSPY